MPASRSGVTRRSRRLASKSPIPDLDVLEADELLLLFSDGEQPVDQPPESSSFGATPSPSASDSAFLSPSVSSPSHSSSSSHSRKKDDGHIRRPLNAFFVFRQLNHDVIKARMDQLMKDMELEGGKKDERKISKIAGQMWKDLSEAERIDYRRRAAEGKQKHGEMYPDYKYRPVYKKDKATKRKSVKINSRKAARRKTHSCSRAVEDEYESADESESESPLDSDFLPTRSRKSQPVRRPIKPPPIRRSPASRSARKALLSLLSEPSCPILPSSSVSLPSLSPMSPPSLSPVSLTSLSPVSPLYQTSLFSFESQPSQLSSQLSSPESEEMVLQLLTPELSLFQLSMVGSPVVITDELEDLVQASDLCGWSQYSAAASPGFGGYHHHLPSEIEHASPHPCMPLMDGVHTLDHMVDSSDEDALPQGGSSSQSVLYPSDPDSSMETDVPEEEFTKWFDFTVPDE